MKSFGTELMPDHVLVQSIEGRLEIASLEVLVHLSIYRHMGMVAHLVAPF
jgi:hypothetical protein